MNTPQSHLLTLLITCFFSNLLAMEQNQYIGNIDKQILLFEIEQKGKESIEKKIDKQRMELEFGNHRLPFIITQRLQKNDSNLSQIIFPLIENNSECKSLNYENQRWNNGSKNIIPIDHCTSVVKNGNDNITIITTFHDKPTLQNVFRELTDNKNKK